MRPWLCWWYLWSFWDDGSYGLLPQRHGAVVILLSLCSASSVYLPVWLGGKSNKIYKDAWFYKAVNLIFYPLYVFTKKGSTLHGKLYGMNSNGQSPASGRDLSSWLSGWLLIYLFVWLVIIILDILLCYCWN